jgi:hypothetical protein
LSTKYGADVLADIPLDPIVCDTSDNGTPIALQEGPHAKLYHDLASKVALKLGLKLETEKNNTSIENVFVKE